MRFISKHLDCSSDTANDSSISVAKGERSLSKLKLIKTYLRSSLAQGKMSNIATLSIENEIAQNINKENLIVKFDNAKARKVNYV